MLRSGPVGLKQPTVMKSTTIHSILAAVAEFNFSISHATRQVGPLMLVK